MDRFIRLLEFPLKLLQRKKDQHKEYPSFIARILTALIDMTLATLIVAPMCALLLSAMYQGMTPSKKMLSIVTKVYEEAEIQKKSETSKQISDTQILTNNPEYKEFMQTHGYSSILYERLMESVVLCMVIFAFWVFKQATPGKLLLGIRVLDAKTLQKPAIYQYVIRIFAYAISVLPLGIGFVFALFNKQKRSLHDILAGTVLVKIKHIKG